MIGEAADVKWTVRAGALWRSASRQGHGQISIVVDLASPPFAFIVEGERGQCMRPRVVIAAIGYVFVGLILCGMVLTLMLALRAGQPFYGQNVYGLAVGTYSTAAVLLIAVCIGVVWLIQRARGRRP